MTKTMKLLLGATIAISVVMVSSSNDLKNLANLEYLKQNMDVFLSWKENTPFLFTASFCLSYILSTAISLPIATILGLLAGAAFGPLLGTIYVSFCSSIGASLAFLIARFLLKDVLRSRYENKLDALNQNLEKHGPNYLLSMRLFPAMPFFLINILMGLSPIKLSSFYWVSQLGMLPGTFIYVYAGATLSKIDSLDSIMSFELFIALTLLGLMPLASILYKRHKSH